MQAMWLPLVDEALALVEDSNLPPSGRAVIRLVAKTHANEGGWDDGLVFFSTREAAKLLVRLPELDRPPCHSTVSRTIPKLLAQGILIGGVIDHVYYLAVNAMASEWGVRWRGGKFAATQSLRLEERDLVDQGWPHRRGLRVAPIGATRSVSTSRSTRHFATWTATRSFLAMQETQCSPGDDLAPRRGPRREKGPFRDAERLRVAPIERDAEPAPFSLLEPGLEVDTVLSRDLERGSTDEGQREPSAAPQGPSHVIDLRPPSEPADPAVEEAIDAAVRAIVVGRHRSLRGAGLEGFKAAVRGQVEPPNTRAALRVVREAPDRAGLNGLDLADMAAIALREPIVPEQSVAAAEEDEQDQADEGFDRRSLIAATREALQGGGGRVAAPEGAEA